MIRRLDVKITLALLLTALLPLGVSVYLVAQAVETSLGVGLNSRIAGHMERGLEVHRKYIEAIKDRQKVRLDHITDSAALKEAVLSPSEGNAAAVLEDFLKADALIEEIRLIGPEGRTLEVKAVGAPDEEPIRTLSRTAEIDMGPYTGLELIFRVDAESSRSFAAAGEDMATYEALLRAPPAYLNRRVIFAYLALLGVIVAASITGGVFWSRRLTRRIHDLGEATSAVARGDLSVRVATGARDEVGELVESFNGMVDELSGSRARIEYLQKISAWQEMARRLAHEIKNPLTPIHLAAQQLREKYDGDDPKFGRLLEQSTEIIEEEVATLRRLTSDFSSFARLPEVRPEPIDLKDFLDECEASLLHIAEPGGVSMVWEIPSERATLRIDRMMMRRVMDNLVRNAADALRQAGVEDALIRITARRRALGRRREIELRVEDNGPGIPPEHRQAIFDPYFTTKAEGTGLGLAISKKIVLEHGGRIWLDDGAGTGASFVIALPLPA
jgi:nitrogen fixation/metabolism regulation signal transduction histidine kinase